MQASFLIIEVLECPFCLTDSGQILFESSLAPQVILVTTLKIKTIWS